jgi:formiminotetrahydrofolate cyclodeaminase
VERINGYLERLASAEPVPGGGSAAAIVAAIGAALVGMVARICERSPKYAAHATELHDVVAETDALRQRLDAARRRDEDAFAQVVAAQALPAGSDAAKTARRGALEAALRNAAQAPLDAASLALDVTRLAERTLRVPNKNLASDLGCAAEFGSAALIACAYNVRVNHRYMRDKAAVMQQSAQLAGYEAEAAAALVRVRAAVSQIAE